MILLETDHVSMLKYRGTERCDRLTARLANDALLLTANRQDYARIPGLRFENWLD